MNTGYSYVATASGDSEFFREAGAPLASALEEILPYHGSDLPKPLYVNPEQQARGAWNDITTPVVLGFIVFVASHLTKKVLDDVYEVHLRPKVKAFLEKLNPKIGGENGLRKIFRAGIWYEEYQVLVTVSVTGESYAEIAEQLHLIPIAHTNALCWISKHGVQKPILHYKIQDGRINVVPQLLDHTTSIIE